MILKEKNNTVEILDELTFGQYQEIKNFAIKKSSDVNNITGEIIIEALSNTLKICIVSVNGITENVVKELNKLPAKFANKVVEKINELTSDVDSDEKKS